MTKEYILNAFKDINYAYNNPSKYDDLSQMLDDLIEDSTYEFIDRLVEDFYKIYKMKVKRNDI